jgi:uncharacterized protein CbrC (UPF0167 family)
MADALPVFKYHPDPLATGSVETSDAVCFGCNGARGYIYTGPVYAEKFDDLSLCPWCIADGTAAQKFGASFGDTGTVDGISAKAREEIGSRTPSFTAWQQDRWLACCGDGAAFLGPAGAGELKRDFSGAVRAVREHLENGYGLEDEDLEEFFKGLRKDGDATAYVFRCLSCGNYLAYVDEA